MAREKSRELELTIAISANNETNASGRVVLQMSNSGPMGAATNEWFEQTPLDTEVWQDRNSANTTNEQNIIEGRRKSAFCSA